MSSTLAHLLILNVTCSTDVLNNAINETGWFIIDVRNKNELERDGLIEAKNWKHIPEADLDGALDQIPSDVKIVCHCKSGSSGGRSSRAAALLKSKGFDAQYYPGGYLKWKDNFTAVTLPL